MNSTFLKAIGIRRGLPGLVRATNVAVLTFCLPIFAQDRGVVLGPPHSLLPGVDQGELLLGELGCISCHAASEGVKSRVSNRTAPILGREGLQLTPQFLRSYLSNPSKEKPGTTMPDVLVGLSDTQRTQAVDELVHYLISVSAGGPATNSSGDSGKVSHGRELFHTIGCVACHAPEVTKGTADATLIAQLGTESVAFPNLARKLPVEELRKFLLNPLRYHPSGRMPSLNLSDREADALAVYLLRDQSPATADHSPAKQMVTGVAYQYFEAAQFRQLSDMDHLTPIDEGSTERLVIPKKHRAQQFGFRFFGQIHAEIAGEYTFSIISDDGSRLSIDGKEVVDNDGIHPSQEVKGRIRLDAGDHNFDLLYFNAGGDIELRAAWVRPGAKSELIPANVLFHSEQKMEPLGKEDFTLDPGKAASGKERFAALGCASCHDVGKSSDTIVEYAKPLLKLNPVKGCLADKPSKKAARYSLSSEQLSSLRATLRNRQTLTQPLDAKAEAAYTLTRLNCIACHVRDGMGGPSEIRSPYFASVGQVDLGDEGRIPPHLTGVGNKLRSDWLRDVLVNKAAARPYMATRMPQFGSNNVTQLVAVLAQADGPLVDEPVVHADDAKYGRKLVGTGGMSCISCHTFAGHKSLGVPAMDLNFMSKRLRAAWFARYVVNPPALRPGTRMPTFWPEGKSVRAEILGGDTTRQVNAIWAFLSSTKDVGIPDGLVQGKVELVADKEAVIYRNFIAGTPRSIGVGYPEKANLNWDANDMRLVSIWQGSFIDSGKHREGRGEGFVNPLGYNVVKFPNGAPLAVLEKPDQKWPGTSGKAGGYQMKGYVLDDTRRPAFHFRFTNIEVEDYPVAKGSDTEAYFVRSLTFKGLKPDGHIWFRAWVGASVEAKANGVYLLDGKIRMNLSTTAGVPLVRQSEGESELLVPVNLTTGEAKIVQEIVW